MMLLLVCPLLIFQSTAPVWGPTLFWWETVSRTIYISIHGPRVGADSMIFAINSATRGFQSTAPVWGPTKPLLMA